MVQRLPLSSEIVLGLGGAIDATLLKGVAGAIAITSITVVGSTLTIGYKDENDAVQSEVFTAGSGAAITVGTADPSGGAAGDCYVQVNASNVVHSVWLNIADTWTEYTLIRLTNTAPRSVSPGANSAGDSEDAAHRNHHHQAPAASSIIHGLVELSTNAEGLDTGDSTHAIVPSVLDHVLESASNTDRIQDLIDASDANEGIAGALRYTDSNDWVRNAERQEAGYHRNLCYFDGALYYSDLAGVIHDVNGNSKTVDAEAVHTIRVANHYVVVTPTELRTYALTSGPVIATHAWTSDTDRIAHSLTTDPEEGGYIVLMSRHPSQAHHLTWYEVSQTDGTISPVNTIEFTLGEINGYLGSGYEDIPSLFGVDGDGLRGAAVNRNHLRLLVNRAISVDDPTDVVSVVERFLITATSPAIQIQHDPDAREILSEFSDSLSIVLPDRDAGVLYFGSISHRSVYERGNRAQVHYENILDKPAHSEVPDALLHKVGSILAIDADKVPAWVRSHQDVKLVSVLPVPTDVADDDIYKIHLLVPTADEPATEAWWLRSVDEHKFIMRAETFGSNPVKAGFSVADDAGDLIPELNISGFAQESTDPFVSTLEFDGADPIDYTERHTDGYAIYYREEGSTGQWRHAQFEVELPPNANRFRFDDAAQRFVDGTTYEIYFRNAVAQNGLSDNVPASDRVQAYPGGRKWEQIPTLESLETLDVIREIIRTEIATPLAAAAATDLFLATINERTNYNIPATLINQLSIPGANILINRGGYTLEDDAGSRQQIVIPVDGTYTIKGSLLIQLTTASLASIRDYIEVALVVLRAGAVLRTASSSHYMRGNLVVPAYGDVSYTADFEAGDLVALGVKDNTADSSTYTVGGGNSFISVIRDAVGTGQAGPVIDEVVLVASTMNLSEYDTSTALGAIVPSTAVPFPNSFTEDEIDRVEIAFDIGSHYVLPHINHGSDAEADRRDR